MSLQERARLRAAIVAERRRLYKKEYKEKHRAKYREERRRWKAKRRAQGRNPNGSGIYSQQGRLDALENQESAPLGKNLAAFLAARAEQLPDSVRKAAALVGEGKAGQLSDTEREDLMYHRSKMLTAAQYLLREPYPCVICGDDSPGYFQVCSRQCQQVRSRDWQKEHWHGRYKGTRSAPPEDKRTYHADTIAAPPLKHATVVYRARRAKK